MPAVCRWRAVLSERRRASSSGCVRIRTKPAEPRNSDQTRSSESWTDSPRSRSLKPGIGCSRGSARSGSLQSLETHIGIAPSRSTRPVFSRLRRTAAPIRPPGVQSRAPARAASPMRLGAPTGSLPSERRRQRARRAPRAAGSAAPPPVRRVRTAENAVRCALDPPPLQLLGVPSCASHRRAITPYCRCSAGGTSGTGSTGGGQWVSSQPATQIPP